jgi:toxic protein SymE
VADPLLATHLIYLELRYHPSFDRTVFVTAPWINLQGQWLDQAGLSIHAPIKIRVMEGCLVLTAEQQTTTP